MTGSQGSDHDQRPRVAVIGAGPSGLYTVAALHTARPDVSIDVFDLLPTPYGLVRYGVAPDHVKMKSVIRVLREPFGDGDVRFIGNVRIGTDLTYEEMSEHYQAIVHATGSPLDRELGIPGEDLPGSVGSAEFVNWYCGRPGGRPEGFTLDVPAIAVVGAGNVALDVARVLAKSAKEMASTDVPDRVLAALESSQVRDIHLLIRRAPEHVKFTPAELRMIGELANADVTVHDDGLLSRDDVVDDSPDRRGRQNIELLRAWSRREAEDRPRRIHLHFLRSPVRVLGEDRVSGVVLERNTVDESGRVRGTGEHETLDVGMIIRAVGYRSTSVPGLPFDAASGTVPHLAGRVVDDGRPVPGAYVTGWIKRGPSGVIGTNKADGIETAMAVLADLSTLPRPAFPDREHLFDLLRDRGVRYVDWAAWERLDAEEIRWGLARDCERVKVAELDAMLRACQGTE